MSTKAAVRTRTFASPFKASLSPDHVPADRWMLRGKEYYMNIRPSSSGSSAQPSASQEAPQDARTSLRRNNRPDTALPISARASSEKPSTLSDLPADLVKNHIVEKLPRASLSALRQTSSELKDIVPLKKLEMHPIEGMHALLSIHQATPHAEVAFAVDQALQAAGRSSKWQDKTTLLLAAQHAVSSLEGLPDRQRLLDQIESQINSSGFTNEQLRNSRAVLGMVIEARQAARD